MSESTTAYTFNIPKREQSIIKAIGIGGGGSNAVNHMFLQGIKDVEFIVCNTDLQALNSSPIPNKLQIGTELTEGLGCGANPDMGEAAALESKDQIQEMLMDTKMIFITAGMGGGTGTGAAPVIAKIAKDMGILTVGIVTMPFSFEGKKKFAQANEGIEALRANCDTVLIILNDKMKDICGSLPIAQAFAEADNVLTTAAKGIAEIITLVGYVNVDFQDVRTVMHNAGAAVMGSAETQGENRASQAAEKALSSPLLNNRDIMGAKRILLSIVSGEDEELQMDELLEITEYIQQQAGENAEVIFGHGIDPAVNGCIRVTVIATGFASEDKMNDSVSQNEPQRHHLDQRQHTLFENMDNSVNNCDMEIKSKTDKKEEDKIREETANADERGYQFTLPDENQKPTSEQDLQEENKDHNETTEPLLANRDISYHQDAYTSTSLVENTIEQNSEEYIKTKKRLQQESEERRKKLTSRKKNEVIREDFSEKWSLPAYLRRGIKITDSTPSSESHVSRYNLNEDNILLGNNKFLHDNVD